ncbi:MAG: dolichyl-phosphate beta-glucosyltransferase [Patescibacteria group bacterium]
MKLSLIIPAHNEESRIGQTLKEYLKFFDKDTEIIVVLNACQDRTLAVVEDIARHSPNLIYTDIKEAIGKGGAVREGFRQASGDLIGFVDADGATSPEEFDKLIQAVADGADGAIASRYIAGARAKRTFLRNIIGLTFHFIQKALFWLPYRDTQCGAKVFRKELIKRIRPELKVKNMVFDIEILARAKKYGYKIKEVPTVWEEKESSALLGSPLKLFRNSFNMFITLIKLRFRFK